MIASFVWSEKVMVSVIITLVIVWVVRVDLLGASYDPRGYQVNAACGISIHVRHYQETTCVYYCKG